MQIMIPTAVGELFDKISILDIKLKKIFDHEKRIHIQNEMSFLQDIIKSNCLKIPDDLYNEIVEVNTLLWETEDLIREKEEKEEFDFDFIKFARADAIFNDKRFLIKKRINEHFGSTIFEQKSYSDSTLQKHLEF